MDKDKKVGFLPDKQKMLDERGRPLTQSLFLEAGYKTEFAIYTLKEWDYEYKGVVYQSLKRLFLEFEDPTEYEFANEYLLNWTHWQRICKNKSFSTMIDSWRYELELKIRAAAVRNIVEISEAEKGFQAARWLADKGWDKRLAGRPTKAEREKETAIQDQIGQEYDEDIARLVNE